MSTFFTSDTHFYHARILELGEGRPFKSIQEHNEMLILNWNKLVMPEDTVYHLGDVALGPWPRGLVCVSRLNGYKKLVPGNHDRIFSGESEKRQERFYEDYANVFDEILPEITSVTLEDQEFVVSHFPYQESEDTSGRLRYQDKSTVAEGLPFIHGHTHQQEKLTWNKDSLQISVGVDARNWTPVPSEVVLEEFRSVSS